MREKKNFAGILLFVGIFFLQVLLPLGAFALSIGTFNIEYFNVSGKKAYSPEDCKTLAERIQSSGAEVLALQEIEGNATMRFLRYEIPSRVEVRGE